jgi:hypothetical protein
LQQHYLPKRGKAGTSVLSFFAQEQESRVLCYANANLTRRDQAGEAMRFVEFWQGITGTDPEWLYFDSKVAPYRELSKLNQRGIWFITIRRRGDPAPFASAAPQQMATRRTRHRTSSPSAHPVCGRDCAITRVRR